MLFSGEQQDKSIKVLSGGKEKTFLFGVAIVWIAIQAELWRWREQPSTARTRARYAPSMRSRNRTRARSCSP